MKLQEMIARKVKLCDDFGVDLVGGVDQAFLPRRIISAAILCNKYGKVLEKSHFVTSENFSYIPGFLCFREGRAAISAVKKLKTRPQLLFVNGCGINHMRGCGLATYVGILLGMATIGITKKLLCGAYVPPLNGRASSIFYRGRRVGLP